MADWLADRGVRLVVLAGYLQLLTPAFLERFPARIVNVHPSLLPSFPGLDAIEQAIEAGVEETGVTVHLVDEGIDSGPVLRQESVPVEPAETLGERIHAVEHRLLPQVVRELAWGNPGFPHGLPPSSLSPTDRPRPPAGQSPAPAATGADRLMHPSQATRRALISVHDKTRLDELARGLHELGWELVASGGTAAFIEELGLPVTRVETVTGFPEMLGHRVVTLHPAVHAGILARRDIPEDVADLADHGIEPFDLVVVNLYPFTETAGRRGVTEEEAVEMIDIGGPALLRGAAKNFAHVGAVARPERYADLLAELRAHGGLSRETRRSLAGEAFVVTAAYESSISAWFGDRETFPEGLIPTFWRERSLAYGENPHQRAAYYTEAGARRHLLSRVEQLGGRELSYNNLNDLSAARSLAEEFTLPACVIVKHANPCGAAVAGAVEDAYVRALGSDPVSAYGGVVVLTRPVSVALAEQLAEQFVEVLFAPGYEDRAIEVLRRKQALRILVSAERRNAPTGERDYRRVLGGLLAQDRDADVEGRDGMIVVCGEPGEADWGDLLFAWRVCKHVTSNAIVVAKDLRTIGIGAGQMSRLDAVRLAVEKAHELGHALEGAALASDAFFPFPDGPRIALDAGVRAIIQPGGSKRDSDVVAAVERVGATMVFTGRRHFRH